MTTLPLSSPPGVQEPPCRPPALIPSPSPVRNKTETDMVGAVIEGGLEMKGP